MADQNEVVLQEIAILREEIALLHKMLEQTNESIDTLNLALLQRLDLLTLSLQEIKDLLPPLPQ